MAEILKVFQYALLVLMLADSHCGAGRSLHFAPDLSVLRVDSGRNVMLQCILGGDSTHGGSFSWTGPAVDSGRASITLDSSRTVSTLTIESVGRSDEGEYSCSFAGVGRVSITLDVRFDAHFLSVDEHQEFIEETDAVVECPAFFGEPPGHMNWTHGGMMITDGRFTLEDGRMRIQNIQESDEGTYTCSINRLGIGDQRFVTVAVLERDSLAPRIVEPSNPIEVMYGNPLDLTCQLEVQRDDVHYTWTVDTDYEDNHFKNTTPVLHRDAHQFLGGRYVCKTENEYGYDEQVFYIRVLASPEPSTCSEQDETGSEGETIVLEYCPFTSPVQLSELDFQWSVQNGNGEWVKIKIRPGGQFRVNHDGFLTVHNVQPSDSGLYRVNISNNQGSALHTVRLQVVPGGPGPDNVILTLRFELIRSADSDGSCQEVQDMEVSFVRALQRAICGRFAMCSQDSDIELRDSMIFCSDTDSKFGTFSATMEGSNAAKMLENIQQFDDFVITLDNGLSLSITICKGVTCTTPSPRIEKDRSSGLVAGVVISVIFLVSMVIATATVMMVIIFKYWHVKLKPVVTLPISPNTGETYMDLIHFNQVKQHQSLTNINNECSCESEGAFTGSSCSKPTGVQDSPTSGDLMLLKMRHNDDYDQGYCSTSAQSLTDGMPVFQTHFFIEADKNAQVPFIYHQLVDCDCSGREYTIVDHDITLKIPEGAVPEGQKVHFEVAVAMYGPFAFPDNTQPISPILWLCIMEQDLELKKPFKIILPHFLTGLTKDQLLYHQTNFAKASHYTHILQNEHIYYEFLPSEDKSGFAFNGCRGYGVLESNHCCFYCLLANKTPELAKDAGYCLARIESSLTLQRSEVYFTAMYFLDSCLKSLEEQFPTEEGYRICRYDDFKFQANECNAPHIKVVAPSEHNQCVVGMEPMTAEIRASDIDFWRKGFEDMRRRHQRKMYPPRVKMTVSLKNPDLTLKLPVKFTGCLSDSQLDVELTFPLGFVWSQSLSLSTVSSASSAGSQAIICDKPKLKDVFKELLPQATEWKTIGTLLGIEEHILDKIKCDEEGARDRLQKMLSEWLKQADPLPTWKELADAMEAVDALKAKELRSRSADIA